MNKATIYSEEAARTPLATVLPDRQVRAGQLCHDHAVNSWWAAMLLANGSAHLAGFSRHRPDVHIASWRGVGVRLRTHSEHTISDKDFEIAQMTEHGVCGRPGEGSALDGCRARANGGC